MLPRCITEYAYEEYYDGCDDDDDNADGNAFPIGNDVVDSGDATTAAANKTTNLTDGPLDDFNGYRVLEMMEEEDWTGLADVQLLLLTTESKLVKRQKQVKEKYDRVDWDRHTEQLIKTKRFHKQYRMPKHHFDYLVDALRDCLTVDRLRSMNSTGGNEPITPEIIVGCGLRYLGLGSNVYDLSQIYGISDSSVHRCINSFLDAIDFNTDCKELQIGLPDPTSKGQLRELDDKWRKVSTAHGLMGGFLGAIDGWLPRIEMPREVDNQVDYFSGHYQCYGLNIQAMCDPDLIFMFLSVTAPGKVNDVRAFHRCNILLDWLEALPNENFIGGDNAYPISQKVLIPFSGSEALDDDNLTYNFYFSQLRIRIEMAFGRFTTKWRILRSTMNNSLAKTAKVIDVCAKLHNFCIRMQQKDGGGRVGLLPDYNTNLRSFGITSLDDGPLRSSEYGYLATVDEDSVVADEEDMMGIDDAEDLYDGGDEEQEAAEIQRTAPIEKKHPSLAYNEMRRSLILNEIKEFGMVRPQHNIQRRAKQQ